MNKTYTKKTNTDINNIITQKNNEYRNKLT